jgi:hypothetical protein
VLSGDASPDPTETAGRFTVPVLLAISRQGAIPMGEVSCGRSVLAAAVLRGPVPSSDVMLTPGTWFIASPSEGMDTPDSSQRESSGSGPGEYQPSDIGSSQSVVISWAGLEVTGPSSESARRSSAMQRNHCGVADLGTINSSLPLGVNRGQS